MIRITENFGKIYDLLTQAALEAKRDPGRIRLLAVSLKQPLRRVAEAVDADERARAEKDWDAADRIRDELQAEGIEIVDTPGGARWRRG